MFFSKFPITTFDITSTDKILVTDIIRAISVDRDLKSDDIFFYEYYANDGETPEIISHKAYKTTMYHWVIMLVNEKFDPWNDFPQTDVVLQKMVTDKYGSLTAVHHYEDVNGNWVDALSNGIPITNIEYARQMNESKRFVKVLKPSVLTEFVSQYQLLSGV